MAEPRQAFGIDVEGMKRSLQEMAEALNGRLDAILDELKGLRADLRGDDLTPPPVPPEA